MENPENITNENDKALEDFKKAFAVSTEGFDVNVGGMIQHFKNREDYLEFLDDVNNRDNR